jgi:hypothetical protein
MPAAIIKMAINRFMERPVNSGAIMASTPNMMIAIPQPVPNRDDDLSEFDSSFMIALRIR